jgi:hypothetical protein
VRAAERWTLTCARRRRAAIDDGRVVALGAGQGWLKYRKLRNVNSVPDKEFVAELQLLISQFLEELEVAVREREGPSVRRRYDKLRCTVRALDWERKRGRAVPWKRSWRGMAACLQ